MLGDFDLTENKKQITYLHTDERQTLKPDVEKRKARAGALGFHSPSPCEAQTIGRQGCRESTQNLTG